MILGWPCCRLVCVRTVDVTPCSVVFSIVLCGDVVNMSVQTQRHVNRPKKTDTGLIQTFCCMASTIILFGSARFECDSCARRWRRGVASGCGLGGWSKYFTLKCQLLNAELHLFEMSNLQKTAKHAGIYPFSGQTLANTPTPPPAPQLGFCLDAFVMNRKQLLCFFPSSIT